MVDIVERLRQKAHEMPLPPTRELREAADEIERLREQERKMTNHALERMEEIERLREALKDIENMPIVYESENIYKQIARSALQQKDSE